jgi:hypothetical protein
MQNQRGSSAAGAILSRVVRAKTTRDSFDPRLQAASRRAAAESTEETRNARVRGRSARTAGSSAVASAGVIDLEFGPHGSRPRSQASSSSRATCVQNAAAVRASR